MLAKFRELDFYRRLPKDLTEQTAHGSALSIFASFFMLILFIAELWSYLSLTTTSNVVIDADRNNLLRINFNISVPEIPCEFAIVSIVDVLGTRTENVSRNVNKWQLDADGVRRKYEGRNMEQLDLLHDVHHDLDELHANGVHAVPMDEHSFDDWLKGHHYTFVNFYAPWCVWCQRLEPVWEAFAEKVEEEDLPVSIIKVDCVANQQLCTTQRIQAFPNLRLFKDDVVQPPDYRNDRTVPAMLEFVKSRLAVDDQLAQLHPDQQREHRAKQLELRNDHPGCMMTGFLLVNKVPGNFHIEARSKHHNLNPVMANVSHVVNHLSFGIPLKANLARRTDEIEPEFFDLSSTAVMDGKVYTNKKLHQAFHHYVKVVTTQLELGLRYKGKDAVQVYQMVQSSQIMQYGADDVPEARFSYDISPMAVVIKKHGKKWYEFLTSICAVIGGTFTMLGLLSGVLSTIFKGGKKL